MTEWRRLGALGAVIGALAAGIGVEVSSGAPLGLPLALADTAVGSLLVVGGGLLWAHRPASRAGVWMWAAGAAWFAGTLGWPLVFLHRAPLVQLYLSYPTGRLQRRLALAAVAAAYAGAIIVPLASNDGFTIAFAAVVAIASVVTFLRAAGPARQAAWPALLAAVAFAGVLSLGVILRSAGAQSEREVLWAYDAAVAAGALLLAADLLRASWSQAVLAGLVVDLDGLGPASTLQARLARALGDPSLVVASWSSTANAYLDDRGRMLELPAGATERVATPVEADGRPLAVILHDPAVLDDQPLVASAAALARVALANGQLQSAVQAQLREIAASRRRLVEAADVERGRLEQLLTQGPILRLRRVSALVASDASLSQEVATALCGEVDAASAELGELAHGVRPARLRAGGLAAALPELAARAGADARVTIGTRRLPGAIESAAYFVCAEALANATKHAGAATVSLSATVDAGYLVLEVSDDGAGGADPEGAGLRGLADRIEALGGSVRIGSEKGAGTRVVAHMPVRGRDAE
jgi:hypothetical protein